MNEFNRLEFIKSQRPKEPLQDWRFWILAAPIVASVIGIATTTMFSLAFDSISIIPAIVQSWIAILGSVITVFASEANSPGTFFELYRRIFKEEKVTGWDYAALVLSTIGSLATILIVCAVAIMTSSTFPNDTLWLQLVIAWMPLIAAVAIVGDNMGALIEVASLYASYENRIDVWYDRIEQEQLQKSPADFQNTIDDLHNGLIHFQEIVTGLKSIIKDLQKSNTNLQNDIAYLQYPKADLQWFKTQLQGANGSLAKYQTMDVVESVRAICRDGGRRFALSDRTAHTWRKEFEK